MWLCTNYGFFSIVRVNADALHYTSTPDNKKDDIFTVRSRVKSHLSQAFKNKKIFEYKAADYQYRVYLTSDELTAFMLDECKKITYSNFKSSVIDPILHDFYIDLWSLGVYAFKLKRK